MLILFLIIGMLEAGTFLFLMFRIVASRRKVIKESLRNYENEITNKRATAERIGEIYAQMVPFQELSKVAKEVKVLIEALRTERGRITITSAELETVETRLRELEEIERELEASNSETEKELNILKKKESDLRNKNDLLKTRLGEKTQELQKMMEELQVSAEVAEQLNAIKAQMATSETKIDALLVQVQQCNEQYISLKMKYDALDIEYAQLYEKFADSGGGAEKEGQ